MKGIKYTLDRINKFINENFFSDYHNWILWCPVLFGLGILLYFRLEYSNIYLFYFSIYFLIFFFIKYKKNQEISTFILACLFFASGYVRTAVYTEKLAAPRIEKRIGYAKIYGTIEDLLYYKKDESEKKRIIVKVEKIEKNGKLLLNPPKYLRVNINNKTYKPKFGDIVEINANIIPIPKQVFPETYNMERIFYFQQLGGIAYNGYIKEHKNPENETLIEKIKNKTYNTRENLNNRMADAIGNNTGAIVGAFITGIRGRIDTEDKNNMTYAGLAHLISISGLNMVIIMGFAFAIIRRILASSMYITLKFNIKKFSAVFAIIIGLLYLSITGFPVSANRAYIMSLLFFFGIILEREVDTMRFLCLSAMIILFHKPNLILEPDFQLSFLAVIGLVSGFKYLKLHEIHTYTTNKYLKPFYYLFAVLISSIMAEISVTPIAIYHFNNYTPYNMVANMVAIPLVAFVTMPCAAFSILLFPFHLEKYLLIPAGWSIDIVLKLSKYIVDLPNSVHIVSSPSILGLSLILLGFLWFTLWEKKWRYFGVPLFILGIVSSIFKTIPNVIIDKDDKLIILISKNGNLYFSNEKNKYKNDIIMRKLGEKFRYNLNDFCIKQANIENCQNFILKTNETFKNENFIENFEELNKKYRIITKDYKILLN